MAYFGAEELIDSIRHGLAIEDDTGFATRVLGRAAKRCKPGGLPLSFAAQTNTSDSDGSPPFEIFSTKAMSTSTLCRQSIAKNAKDVQNLIQARRSQKPKLDQEQIDHYFNARNVSVNTLPLNSMLSRQIEEGRAMVCSEKFSEFARFEAFENEPNSKLIHIVFPFADHPLESPMQMLPVYAKNHASMDEFIGLCCFLYTRSGFTPKCSEPWRYSLYMADDSFVDTELPPIDRHRSVGKCGFTMLALVENKDELAKRKNKYTVTVHMVNGLKFLFELGSLNESLEWLRDKALQRRDELSVQRPRVMMRQTIYELQTLDSEQSLKLSNTISSTGVLEFLLIRKNSSRANFNPMTLSEPNEVGLKAPLFVQTRQRPTDLSQTRPLSSSSFSSLKMINNVSSPTTSIRSGFGYGNLIQEYMVERVHRLKPKCSSKLVLRDDCLELAPVQVEKRRAFVPQTTQKFTSIAWDLIGGVDSERHGARRITKITWLPVSSEVFELQENYLKHLSRTQKRANDNFYQEAPSQALSESSIHSSVYSTNIDTDASSSPAKTINSTRPSLNESSFNGGGNYLNDFDPTPLLKAYDSLAWKYIQIEASDDDSWQISMKIIEIIDAKNSITRQIFHNSCGGSRKLRLAAEEVFSLKAGFNYSPNEPKRLSTAISALSSVNNLKTYKKRKSINPVPLLNRMLSKQE